MSEEILNLKKLLGCRIAKLRNSKNLTQMQFAEKVGIAPNTLANIEIGKRFLTAETLEKIKEVLGVEYRDLFDFTDMDDIKASYEESINTLDFIYKNRPNLMPIAKVFLRLLKK